MLWIFKTLPTVSFRFPGSPLRNHGSKCVDERCIFGVFFLADDVFSSCEVNTKVMLKIVDTVTRVSMRCVAGAIPALVLPSRVGISVFCYPMVLRNTMLTFTGRGFAELPQCRESIENGSCDETGTRSWSAKGTEAGFCTQHPLFSYLLF